jgi:hypothetical protein
MNARKFHGARKVSRMTAYSTRRFGFIASADWSGTGVSSLNPGERASGCLPPPRRPGSPRGLAESIRQCEIAAGRCVYRAPDRSIPVSYADS